MNLIERCETGSALRKGSKRKGLMAAEKLPRHLHCVPRVYAMTPSFSPLSRNDAGELGHVAARQGRRASPSRRLYEPEGLPLANQVGLDVPGQPLGAQVTQSAMLNLCARPKGGTLFNCNAGGFSLIG